MTATVFGDPIYGAILFGDTSGSLSSGQAGLTQGLNSSVAGSGAFIDYLVGDARDLIGDAQGGRDYIQTRASIEVGDALTMSGASRGGNDVVTLGGVGGPGQYGDAAGYGDAISMTDHATGGDDVLFAYDLYFASGGPLYGDAYDMSGDARGGNDRLSGYAGLHTGLTLYGDAYAMSQRAVGGNDLLTGIADQQSLYAVGDALIMSDDTRGGNDRLIGSRDADNALFGDGYALSGHVRGGNDEITGGDSSTADLRFSPNIDNQLVGDGYQLSDQVVAGDDILIGGRYAPDTMWGDGAIIGPNVTRGHNQFVFSSLGGMDAIMDFNPGNDHIVLRNMPFSSFADLASLITQDASGSTITFDDADSIFVAGVGQLTAADFVFDDPNGRNVSGGSRGDVLTAGGGNNSFYGASGSDTFVIQARGLANSIGGSTHGIKGADSVIMDFAGAGGTPAGDNDVLQLSGFGAGSTLTFDHANARDPTAQFYTVHDTASGADFHLYIHSLDGQQLTPADYSLI